MSKDEDGLLRAVAQPPMTADEAEFNRLNRLAERLDALSDRLTGTLHDDLLRIKRCNETMRGLRVEGRDMVRRLERGCRPEPWMASGWREAAVAVVEERLPKITEKLANDVERQLELIAAAGGLAVQRECAAIRRDLPRPTSTIVQFRPA